MHYCYQPGKSDVLGDRWAVRTRDVWKRMLELDPELTSKPHAGSLWQWAQCELADMKHRVVASPEAIAMAAAYNGDPELDLDLLDPLLELSDKVMGEDE